MVLPNKMHLPRVNLLSLCGILRAFSLRRSGRYMLQASFICRMEAVSFRSENKWQRRVDGMSRLALATRSGILEEKNYFCPMYNFSLVVLFVQIYSRRLYSANTVTFPSPLWCGNCH